MYFTLALLALMTAHVFGRNETANNKESAKNLEAPFNDLDVSYFWSSYDDDPAEDCPISVRFDPEIKGFALFDKFTEKKVSFGDFFGAIESIGSSSRHAMKFNVRNLWKEKSAQVMIEAFTCYPPKYFYIIYSVEYFVENAPASEATKFLEFLYSTSGFQDGLDNINVLFERFAERPEKQQLFWPFFAQNPKFLHTLFPLESPDSLEKLIDPIVAQTYLDLATHLQAQEIKCDFPALIPALKLIVKGEQTPGTTNDFYLSLLLRFSLIGEEEFRLKHLEAIMDNPAVFPSTVNQILGPCRNLMLWEHPFLESVVPFLNQNQCQKISLTIEEKDVGFLIKVLNLTKEPNNLHPLIREIADITILEVLHPQFPESPQGIELKYEFSRALTTVFLYLEEEAERSMNYVPSSSSEDY